MYEEIETGMYDQMSFAFVVKEDSYDRETHTRTIRQIAKMYDVSAVSFPANPGTDIGVATRSYFDGVIEAERAERLEREAKLTEARNKYREVRNNGN
jgi:phage head maturation protease